MEAQASPGLSQQFVEIMVLLHNNFGRQTQVPLPLNQFGVLCALMDTQGLDIIDLSRQLNIAKQQMTNVIEKLLTAGYVSKNPDPKDRRRFVVTISDKGEKLLADHMEQFRQRFEIHARNLTTDERQELASILRRYYELINKMFL